MISKSKPIHAWLFAEPWAEDSFRMFQILDVPTTHRPALYLAASRATLLQVVTVAHGDNVRVSVVPRNARHSIPLENMFLNFDEIFKNFNNLKVRKPQIRKPQNKKTQNIFLTQKFFLTPKFF